MKSSFKRTIFLAVGLLLLVALIAGVKALIDQPSSNGILLSGTVEADEVHIGSKIGGRVGAVLVKEGQEVKLGQPIIRFESFDLEAKNADAVAAVAAAEANLERTRKWFRPEELAEARAAAEAAWMTLELARHGPRKQEIDASRAELDAANADYEVAKVTLERVERLTRDGVQSRQDYDNARAAFERAEARREAAQQRLDLLLAGTRTEEIERAERQYRQAAARKELVENGAREEDIKSAQSALDRARAALQAIEVQLGELEVRAPSDAFVEVLQVRPGDLVNPNSPVATLVEVDRLWVRVFVPEPDLGFVQLGKEVSVQVDSFPGVNFSGHVEQISSRGEFTPRNVQTREERTHQVFGVRVRVDNSERRLRAGMAADVVVTR
jgi:multidrug resistance efflux pump